MLADQESEGGEWAPQVDRLGDVVGAATGLEALLVWRDLNGPPDPQVVILDNRLPDLRGLQVAAQMLSERPQQLIVLCSSVMTDDIEERAAAVWIVRCISKRDIDLLPALVQDLTA